VAIVVAALLQILLFSVRARVQEHAELWPLMYVPALLGVLYLAALLVRLSRERRPGRAAAGLPA
jgi:hypothetical protein